MPWDHPQLIYKDVIHTFLKAELFKVWALTPPEAGAQARPHVEGVNVVFSNQSGIFWRLGLCQTSCFQPLKVFFFQVFIYLSYVRKCCNAPFCREAPEADFLTFLGEYVKTTKPVSRWLNLSFKSGALFVINSLMKSTGGDEKLSCFSKTHDHIMGLLWMWLYPGVVPDGVSDIIVFDC